jgi:hypothetical protein
MNHVAVALVLAAAFAVSTPPVRAATCERDEGAWRVIACPQRSGGRDYTNDYGDVARRDVPAGGPNVAVFFGGWSAHDIHVRAWVDALERSGALAHLRIGRLYAVPGPFDSAWGARREVPWQPVAIEVGARSEAKLVLVAAHSSGAFVADSFVAALGTEHPALLARTAVFKLDGGWLGQLAEHQWRSLGMLSCVSAKKTDPRTHAVLRARNYCAMSTAQPPEDACRESKNYCGKAFPGKATWLVIDASDTACISANCLHDALITTAPHTPSNFNLADDYVKFDATHRVQTGWLEQSAAALERLASGR